MALLSEISLLISRLYMTVMAYSVCDNYCLSEKSTNIQEKANCIKTVTRSGIFDMKASILILHTWKATKDPIVIKAQATFCLFKISRMYLYLFGEESLVKINLPSSPIV